MVMIPTCTVTAVALFISIMMLVIVIAEKYAINYDKMNIEEKFQERKYTIFTNNAFTIHRYIRVVNHLIHT